ncbi:MAG: YabP/YqfC family sporulation protein [Clostridia bacterium]|nr:YabP/YqfC family sporulation protein [Clostridia bacterium]
MKNVVFSSEEKVKLRSKKQVVTIDGKGLKIVEIGDGNALIAGEVYGVQYE